MPFYRTNIRPGLLDLDARAVFSQDVVDVHCDVTGAPPSFVHVMFTETDTMPDGIDGQVFGTIRSGRNGDQKTEIAGRLSVLLAERAGVAADAVTVHTADIEASYTMEGGVLLPEPGSVEEEAWKAS